MADAPGHGGRGAIVPGNMLDQVEQSQEPQRPAAEGDATEGQAVPRAPRTGGNSYLDNDSGAAQVTKWRGAILTKQTWAEWVRYHYHPARQARKQQYAEARPIRAWSPFAEYSFLDSCVDHTVRGIREARMRLIDDGLFERDDVDYTDVTDVYKGYLSEVGSAAAVESQRQVVTERAGGFQQTPSELARAVRAAHVARFGRTNFTEANKLLYSLLVKPWATIEELKRREPYVKWELQELRFSEADNLAPIAMRIQEYEDKAIKEETDARLLQRDYELQRQLPGGQRRDTIVVDGRHLPRCDVCTALNLKNQHHYGNKCAVRKTMKQQVSEDTKTNASTSGRRGSMYVLENDDHQEDSAEALAMRGGPPQGRARDFSGKKPTPPAEGECWNCKGKGHRYTDCEHQITDENCLRRLKTVPYEYERRKRFLEKNPLARRGANEQPPPVKSILKNTSRDEQRGNASGSPMREDDTDEDYWLTNNTTVFTQLLPMKPEWQSDITAQAGTMARRGRPAQLPPGSRNDRGLRMQQPGWEEQRERMNHLPQGFEPGMPANQGSAGPSPASATEGSGEFRQHQLYQVMRSAFQHARFPSLSTTAITEGGEQQRQRWIAAREQVLQGRYDQRDHCAVAWQAAVDDVVRRFLAQARLSWNDLCQVVLRGICRQAVQSVYGLTIEQEMSVPPAVSRAPLTTIQEDIMEQDVLPATMPPTADVPIAEEAVPHQQVDQIVSEYMQRLRQWKDQPPVVDAPAESTVAPNPDMAVEDQSGSDDDDDRAATNHTVHALDVTARQALAADDPILLCRQKQIAEQRPRAMVRRRLMALVDTDVTAIKIGHATVTLTLLDSGCDWLSIREDVAVNAGYTYSSEGVSVQGATGQTMSRRTQQPVDITINPNTNWEVTYTVPSAVVHTGMRLPEVIVDTGTLAAMMGVLDFGQWQFTYPVDPAHMATGGGVHASVPLTPVPMDCLQALSDAELGGGDQAAEHQANSASQIENQKKSARRVHFEYDDESAPPQIAVSEARTKTPNMVESYETQRQTVIAAGKQLPYGPHDEATIKAVGTLMTTPDPRDNIYIGAIEKIAGEHDAGVRGLYVCAGMLTSLMQHLEDGVHFETVFILEKDVKLRSKIPEQLDWMHRRHPKQLPKSAFASALVWADDIEHDVAHLSGKYLMQVCGELDEIYAEPPCQGVSAYGLQLGLHDFRTGVVVDLAAALVDYQYLLAQRRGIKDWAHAPAQFGFVIENVAQSKPDEHSPEVEEFYIFMAHVFGDPFLHKPHEDGSLSTRTACWWTNTFPGTYYEKVKDAFHRNPPETLAEVVDAVTAGALAPQIASKQMERINPLNQAGEVQRCQPKYVRFLGNVQQVMSTDGQPGAGMLSVVGSSPPQFVRTPAAVRERCLGAPMGFYTRAELGLTEEQQIGYIGNVCSPISVSVITRIRISFALAQRELVELKMQSLAPGLDVEPESKEISELRSAVDKSIEMEKEYAKAARQVEQHWEPKQTAKQKARGKKAPKAGIVDDAQQSAAWERRRQEKTKHAAAVGKDLQQQREQVASSVRRARWSAGDPKVTQRRTKSSGAMSAMLTLTLLTLLSVVCGQCYSAGAACGAEAMIAAMKEPRTPMTKTKDVSPELLASCYAAFGNPKATGLPEEVIKVPGRLRSTKDGSEHFWQIGEGFKSSKELAQVMDDEGLYAWGLHDLKKVNHEPYEFELTEEKPIFRRQYHLAKREADWAEAWVKELERYGLVEEINSPWAAPVVVAPKKDETGAWTDMRYAVDYRGVNNITKRDRYPCPTAEDLMSRMDGACLYTCCDAQKAFHSLEVSEHCRKYLAFHAGNRLMAWTRMPFGHKNAVAAWQRVVDDALRGLDFAAAFADDIIIWSGDDEQEHIRRVRIVMQRLKAKGVQLSPKKCKLGMRRIEWLGHILSSAGVEPQWSKVEAINALPAPKNSAEVRSFLGMATYYCKFLPEYSHVKKPLTELTRQQVPWQWTAVESGAFEKIKSLLTSAPVLRNLIGLSPSLCTLIGARLEWEQFSARLTNKTMSDWTKPFTLHTDWSKAMEWLRSTAKLRAKLARWSLILAEYDFSVKHRPGKDNTVPDLLSRQPAAAGALLANMLGQHPLYPYSWRSLVARNSAALFALGAAEAITDWPTKDIWDSPWAIRFVRGELPSSEVTAEQWAALSRKCAPYQFAEGRIWRRVGKREGRWLEVPPPEQRYDIIHMQHVKIGHLGRDRTYHMLSRYYHWPGMHQDVSSALKQCRVCDRAKATFSVKNCRLKPMPIFGQFYRFSVDSAGPFRPSQGGYKYVIIIVEHFSKWIELAPVVDLNPDATAATFMERVLARYGAPVEVVTGNGQEYKGRFAAQLKQHSIDQVEIPAGHPSSNGMAERIVQVLKSALRKFISSQGILQWNTWLPIIEFGYRVTIQRATGFSPYFLMYGRDPISPVKYRALLQEPVDVDDEAQMLDLISARADILRAAMPRAFENALRAQVRDVIRYRKVRQGDVQPRSHRFTPGSYVYYVQRPLNTLDVKVTRTILRVHKVHSTGWLELVGSDGRIVEVHGDQCAPCHLSNLVPAGQTAPALTCEQCGSDSRSDALLVCDKCSRAWHSGCVSTEAVDPEAEWLCPRCMPRFA